MSGPPPPAPLPPDVAAENKGPMMLGLTWAFTSLSTLFVIGRVISRRKKIGRLAVDDYIIIFSLILAFVFLGFCTTSIHYGSGRHAATLSIDDLQNAIMYITIGFVPGILSFTVPKFAVIILLCNLLNPTRAHRWFLWILAAIDFIAIIICIVFVYASCTPAYAMWTLSVKPVCWDPNWVVYSSVVAGAISAFMDLYLAIYPAIVLWGLQMNIRKKLGLSVALGFGLFAGAVAIHKCTTIPGVGNRTDFTYGTEDLVLWTNIECNCVIIAACVPMLLPLVEMIFGSRFMGDTSRKAASYWPFSGSRTNGAGGTKRQGGASGVGGLTEKGSHSHHGTHIGGDRGVLSSTASGDSDDLKLGDAAPGKIEISSTPADTRAEGSQESIIHDESIGGAPRGSGGDGSSRGIVRHDRVVVEYEPPSNKGIRGRWR